MVLCSVSRADVYAALQPRTAEEQEKAEKRLLKRQAQKKRKLEEAGIKYDFDAVAYVCFSFFSHPPFSHTHDISF